MKLLCVCDEKVTASRVIMLAGCVVCYYFSKHAMNYTLSEDTQMREGTRSPAGRHTIFTRVIVRSDKCFPHSDTFTQTRNIQNSFKGDGESQPREEGRGRRTRRRGENVAERR